MKTKPTAPRMPRARAHLATTYHTVNPSYPSEHGSEYRTKLVCDATWGRQWTRRIHTLKLHGFTAQQARKLAAFWNLTPEDQHETIVLITEDGNRTPNDQATAILAAIGGQI